MKAASAGLVHENVAKFGKGTAALFVMVGLVGFWSWKLLGDELEERADAEAEAHAD